MEDESSPVNWAPNAARRDMARVETELAVWRGSRQATRRGLLERGSPLYGGGAMWCRRCRDDFPESSRVGCAPTRCHTHQRCLHCYMLGEYADLPPDLLARPPARALPTPPNRRLHDR